MIVAATVVIDEVMNVNYVAVTEIGIVIIVAVIVVMISETTVPIHAGRMSVVDHVMMRARFVTVDEVLVTEMIETTEINRYRIDYETWPTMEIATNIIVETKAEVTLHHHGKVPLWIKVCEIFDP